MLNPFATDPETAKFGNGLGGWLGQMSMTFPFTVPRACPLSLMLSLAQMSPVTFVVDVPVNTSDCVGPPLQLPGLNVWIAAPYVPFGRATAVAVAPTFIVEPPPSTCMNVIATWWTPVTLNVTPAIEWSATLIVTTWLVGSPKLQET